MERHDRAGGDALGWQPEAVDPRRGAQDSHVDRLFWMGWEARRRPVRDQPRPSLPPRPLRPGSAALQPCQQSSASPPPHPLLFRPRSASAAGAGLAAVRQCPSAAAALARPAAAVRRGGSVLCPAASVRPAASWRAARPASSRDWRSARPGSAAADVAARTASAPAPAPLRFRSRPVSAAAAGPRPASSAAPARAGWSDPLRRFRRPASAAAQKIASVLQASAALAAATPTDGGGAGPAHRPRRSAVESEQSPCVRSSRPAVDTAPDPPPPLCLIPDVLCLVLSFVAPGASLRHAALVSLDWLAAAVAATRVFNAPFPERRRSCGMCGARRCRLRTDEYCPGCSRAFVSNSCFTDIRRLESSDEVLRALGPPDSVDTSSAMKVWKYQRVGVSVHLSHDAAAVVDGSPPPGDTVGYRPSAAAPLPRAARWKLMRKCIDCTRVTSVAAIEFHRRYPHPLPDGITLGGRAFETVGQHLWVDYNSSVHHTCIFTFEYTDSAANYGGVPYRCLHSAFLHLRTIPLTEDQRADPWANAKGILGLLADAGYSG